MTRILASLECAKLTFCFGASYWQLRSKAAMYVGGRERPGLGRMQPLDLAAGVVTDDAEKFTL